MKIITLFLTLPMLSACNADSQQSFLVNGELFQVEDQALEIRMMSSNGSAVCVPIDQFSDVYGKMRLKLQSGEYATKASYAAKPVQIIGGVDLAGGVYIVSSKEKKIYPSLDNFQNKNLEVVQIEMRLVYFNCDELKNEKLSLKKIDVIFK